MKFKTATHRVRLVNLVWIGLCLGVVGVALVIGARWWNGHSGKPGVNFKPWGKLTIEPLTLEAPDEYLADDRPRPEELDWFVPQECLNDFLERMWFFDVTPDQRAAIQDKSRWRTSTNGWRFRIDRTLILGLKQTGRGQIYLFLSNFPENGYQHFPFILSKNDVDTCLDLDDSGLKPDTGSLLKRLLYKRGPSWCFSDMYVFRDLPTDEFKQLLKTLLRVSTLVVKLNINKLSDIEGLTRYWGKNGTERHTRTLLRSLALTPGGTTLDVVHFFPPLAREHLYKYPDEAYPDAVAEQQCFWTALNFFNPRPDNRFAARNFVQETLVRDYFQLSEERRFGDLIVLVDGADRVFHCSVYIAEDIVFTKNGGQVEALGAHENSGHDENL
jgi:hypothetical protein